MHLLDFCFVHLPSYVVSSLRQGPHLFYPLINSISLCQSHLSDEEKMASDEWMTVTWTRLCMNRRHPVFSTPSQPTKKLLGTAGPSRGQVMAWGLFLYSWPGRMGLRFCEVHWKDGSQSINSGTPFSALKHISVGALDNSSNLCCCQFQHLIWSYKPCPASVNHFVLLTWKWMSPVNKSISAGYSETTGKSSGFLLEQ